MPTAQSQQPAASKPTNQLAAAIAVEEEAPEQEAEQVEIPIPGIIVEPLPRLQPMAKFSYLYKL